jgi:hypothetical protein
MPYEKLKLVEAQEAERARLHESHLRLREAIDAERAREAAEKPKRKLGPAAVSMFDLSNEYVPLVEERTGATFYWCRNTNEVTWDPEVAARGGTKRVQSTGVGGGVFKSQEQQSAQAGFELALARVEGLAGRNDSSEVDMFEALANLRRARARVERERVAGGVASTNP